MYESMLGDVTYIESTRELAAVVHCRPDARYLAFHFPGFPVMPGVLLLESIRQTFAIGLEHLVPRWEILGYEDFRFRQFVRPDDFVNLKLRCNFQEGTVDCRGYVGSECVVRGRLLIRPGMDAAQSRYRMHNCRDFDGWMWYQDYEEGAAGSGQRQVRSRLAAPGFARDCPLLIPEPFLLEALAQTAVKMVERKCLPGQITALAKITSAILQEPASYLEMVTLEVSELGAQPQGGIFEGRAAVGQRHVLTTEMMLIFADQNLDRVCTRSDSLMPAGSGQ